MIGRQAEPALLGDSKPSRRLHGGTAVLPRRPRASPSTVGHQVRADPRRPGLLVGRCRPGAWRGRVNDVGLAHLRQDTQRTTERRGPAEGRPPLPANPVPSRQDSVRHPPAGPRRATWPAENVSRKRKNPGDDLCSRKAALSVSSALESLTSVFGMGTGVASPLESPGFSASGCGSAAAHPPARAGAMRPRRRSSISAFRVSRSPRRATDHLETAPDPDRATLGQLLKRSSPRPLVRLSFIRHRTSTCRLSNR